MKISVGPEVRVMSLDDLTPAPYNPRKISKEALSGLGASIKRFGMVEPLIFNERSKRLVGGHQRLKALRAAGAAEASVVVVDLPEVEEKALNVALNSPHIAGEFSADLGPLLAELEAALPDSMFEGLRFDALLDLTPRDVVEDEIPEPPTNPVTKPGDLWVLEGHRLLCGDSTKPEDVSRVLGEQKPFLMVTDPPYGVEYDPEWRVHAGVNRSRKKLGKVQNDDRADWRAAWELFPGDVAYVWHAGLHAAEVEASLRGTGLVPRAQIVWSKDRFALSRGDYHWQHEPCWYAVREGCASRRSDDRSQSTVWEVAAREDTGHGHGTQKPVEVMARPIRNHDAPEVYDPFLGSGTTLIAAEQLRRRCFGLEIEPAYCDVVVQRWERLTGREATRVQR